jgi:hypothetical protein
MTSHHFNIETSGIARAAARGALANTFAKFAAIGKLGGDDTGAPEAGLLPILSDTPDIHEPNEARA